jgi:hypothetical protein
MTPVENKKEAGNVHFAVEAKGAQVRNRGSIARQLRAVQAKIRLGAGERI